MATSQVRLEPVSGFHSLHQLRVGQNFDAAAFKEDRGRRLEEIPVHCAQDVCLSNQCGLENDYILRVTDRRNSERVPRDPLCGLTQPANKFINCFFVLTVIHCQARIAQDSCHFRKHFVGEKQLVGIPENRQQKLVGESIRVCKCADQNIAVENNPHGIGV